MNETHTIETKEREREIDKKHEIPGEKCCCSNTQNRNRRFELARWGEGNLASFVFDWRERKKTTAIEINNPKPGQYHWIVT